MNLVERHQLIYEFNQKGLYAICEAIRNIKSRIIIIEGCSGSGKSTVIEELVSNNANIFTSSNLKPYSGSFNTSPSESNYIAVDEVEYFNSDQIIKFLLNAEAADQIALIASQDIELFNKAMKGILDIEKPCLVRLK